MRVLWVEDDRRLGPMITRALVEDGIDVVLVEDGIDGAERALAESWDLVMLDRRLPGMDGLEIVGRIRAAGGEVPIFLLTAMSDVDDRVVGLCSGADDYLVKPFAYAELLARIRLLVQRATARRSGSSSADLVVGGVKFDQVRHVARYGDREAELTVREYALAALLARQAGTCVPRQVIIQEVWGSSEDLYDNVVDLTISRLRRKLEGIGVASLIATIRGIGYQMGSSK
jgi:two-component system copper resistance phosphate regulon response regulator CusR